MLDKFVPPGSKVLDVGCAESALSHELVARGYEVWCIDINDPLFAPKSVKYVKADIRQTGLSDNFFDAIIVVSTIEHVGMPAYGQEVIEEDGDLEAMNELRRIVKPGGYIILTTPFRGKELIIELGERQYSAKRLKQLMEGLKPIIIKIYAPKRIGKRIVWEELSWQEAQNLTLKEPGIACLILQK